MGLEEDIVQKAFKSEYHKLAVNILYTHGWLVSHLSAALRPHDITVQQYNILRILRGQYPAPATITLLKDRMLDRVSDASRLVERLRAKGLVERRATEGDRRKAGVVITQKGMRLLEQIGDVDGMARALFGGIEENDVRKVNLLLDAMRESG